MFYRMAVFFFKRDGSLAPRAVAFVSLSQTLLIISFLTIIIRQFYELHETAVYKGQVGKYGAALALILLVLNYWRYRRGYSKLSDRWSNNESLQQKRIRGVLVAFGVVLPFILVLFLATSGYRQ